MGLIPGSGQYTGEGNGYPFQHACLEIPWTEAPLGYTPWGRKESDMSEHTYKQDDGAR